MKIILIILSISILTACASQEQKSKTLPTFEHYRACDLMSLDFISSMQCGKTTRNSYCLPDNKCSKKGNKLVAYYDGLVESVQKKKLTELEARKLFLKRNKEAEIEYTKVMFKAAIDEK